MNELKDGINDNAALADSLRTEFDSLELIAGQVPFNYEFSTNTLMADPGTSYIRVNNAALNGVTIVAMSATDETGVDISDALTLLIADSYFYFCNRSNAKMGALYKVNTITDDINIET